MTPTRSQIERLGVRLVGSDRPAAGDLAALHDLLLVYGDALADAVAKVYGELAITPTARVKTTGTILEKLRRHGGSWLKSIQDIAGMRIVGDFDRRGQDALVAHLVELFADADRRPKVVDRCADPSHGCRAVHVIVFVQSLPIEIQVRTRLQHEWADLYEKLADKVGRGIRYGEPPDPWLTVTDRSLLSDIERRAYEFAYQLTLSVVDMALAIAEMIDKYEIEEIKDPGDPALHESRAQVNAALAELSTLLNAD
jgi:hypothetical protein